MNDNSPIKNVARVACSATDNSMKHSALCDIGSPVAESSRIGDKFE